MGFGEWYGRWGGHVFWGYLWLTVADEASGSSSGTCLAAPPSSKQSRPHLPLEPGKHQEVS